MNTKYLVLLLFYLTTLLAVPSSAKGYINDNGFIQHIDDNDDVIIPAPEELHESSSSKFQDEDYSDQCSGDHDHRSHSHSRQDEFVKNSKRNPKKSKNKMKGYERWDDHFAREARKKNPQSRSSSSSPSSQQTRRSMAAKLFNRLSGGSLLSDKESKMLMNNQSKGLSPRSWNNNKPGFGVGGAVGGNRRGMYDDGMVSAKSPMRRNRESNLEDEEYVDEGGSSPGSRDYIEYMNNQRKFHSSVGMQSDYMDDDQGEDSFPYRFRNKRFFRRQPSFESMMDQHTSSSMMPEETFIRGRGRRKILGDSYSESDTDSFQQNNNKEEDSNDSNNEDESDDFASSSSSIPVRKRIVERLRKRLFWW